MVYGIWGCGWSNKSFGGEFCGSLGGFWRVIEIGFVGHFSGYLEKGFELLGWFWKGMGDAFWRDFFWDEDFRGGIERRVGRCTAD